MNETTIFTDYPDMLNLTQIQKALAISYSLAYKLVKTGKLKSICVGSNIRVPKPYLIEYVKCAAGAENAAQTNI